MDSPIRLYNTNGSVQPQSRPDEARAHGPDVSASREEQGAQSARSDLSATAKTQADAIAREPAQQVDVADFEAIFLRFQGPITNYIYHLIGNREQACDLAQDIFVKAYRALLNGTVVQPGALSAWLYRIAANTTTDSLRRRRLIAWLPLSLFNEDRGIGAGVVSESGGVASEAFSTDDESGRGSAGSSLSDRGSYDGGRFENRVADRELVERIFKKLPPKYASCLWLYENDGLSCAEIADILDISSSAVKMRLMRARERFVNLYKQEVSEE